MTKAEIVKEAEIVGMGIGGIKRGISKMIMNDTLVPIDQVNVNTFLGSIAACTAKKVSLLIPGIKSIVVIVKAYGDVDAERIDYLSLEVSYESESEIQSSLVEKALWLCPILNFLRDKIEKVSISRCR